ncbi:hypothetical protein CPB84DRAFT_1751984 [Gymnopilus junonius]|uniref:Uncharacterized protein n=1 Tax=Gymnopilus junonius TaxID=109634 RepID=A0A9P5NC36_GYMJU|nr:hypothetical protein CPB84DRAFT_1751984 [Gymnopilus junonius]
MEIPAAESAEDLEGSDDEFIVDTVPAEIEPSLDINDDLVKELAPVEIETDLDDNIARDPITLIDYDNEEAAPPNLPGLSIIPPPLEDELPQKRNRHKRDIGELNLCYCEEYVSSREPNVIKCQKRGCKMQWDYAPARKWICDACKALDTRESKERNFHMIYLLIPPTHPPTCMSNTDPPRKCAKPWCRQIARPGHHTCNDCRVRDRENQQKSRAKRHEKKALTAAAALDPSTKVRCRGDHDTGPVRDPKCQRTREVPQDHGETEDEDNFEPVDVLDFNEPDEDAAVNYLDAEDLFDDLQAQMKASAHVDFLGTYALDANPGHESPKERVLMVAKEIWQTLGFRWTVKDHKKQKTGHRTRYWCSQDIARKKKSKPSQAPGAKHHDYIGMMHYPCRSRLSIVYRIKKTGQTYIIIDLHHHFRHTHYIDVTMPLEAMEIIEAQVEWATPSALSSVSGKCTLKYRQPKCTMHGKHIIPSATKLLEEFADEADIFTDLYIPDSVEMLAFSLKKVAEQLKGKVVEEPELTLTTMKEAYLMMLNYLQQKIQQARLMLRKRILLWVIPGKLVNSEPSLPPPMQHVPMHGISDDRSNQENQHHSNVPSTQPPEICGQGFVLRLLDPHESSQAHSPKENTEEEDESGMGEVRT